jgi:tRNA-splicing ligase RtcB
LPGGSRGLGDVYKRQYQGNTIEIVHRLKPIGVVMAGNDIYDPYKDA